MDYSLLRQEGIRWLERLSGGVWTDFNHHDPGITLLEQLCYVLSDVGYRIEHPIPDLLAENGRDAHASLHAPHEILSTQPVTIDDLRRQILDVDGVKNAWCEPAVRDAADFYFSSRTNDLRLSSGERSAQPVKLRGLHHVFIEASGDVESPLLRSRVAERLYAHRGLGEDLAEITVLQTQPIQLDITLDVAPLDDPQSLVSDVRACLAEAISPTVPFAALNDQLQLGASLDDLFEGPLLRRGFLAREVLASLKRRTTLHSSDLMHALMNLPQVRAVSRIRISKGGAWEEWSLPIDDDKAPRLDAFASKLTLRRAGQVIHRSSLKGSDSKSPQRGTANPQPSRSLSALAARSRNVARYTSLQNQLPVLYGIGESGLPESASEERKAKAKQLAAYLLFFDQLCANQCAQLAHIADLFSFHSGSQTYFTQVVESQQRTLDAVRTVDDGHRARVQDLVEPKDSEAALQRKNRLLNHLLARFAEPISDSTLSTSLADRSQQKQALLQHYPALSSARGTAQDLLGSDADLLSGIEARLRIDLSFDRQQGEDLVVIEHVLLRPIKEDILRNEQGQARQDERPLLSAVQTSDPYSLQVSFVLPDGVGRFARLEFKQFIEDQLRQRLPAHLVPFVHWLNATAWSDFRDTHRRWQNALRSHIARSYSLKRQIPVTEQPATPEPRPIDLRGARDRLIDLLRIGETYPLLDTAVHAQSLTVGYNMSPTLFIDPAQVNVRYELCDEHGVPFAGHTVDGSASLAVLNGPTIQHDHTFTIRAFKIDRPDISTFLSAIIAIKIGLNTDLAVWMPQVSPQAPVVDYGTAIEVRVAQTQAGARYALLNDRGQEVSLASVMGNGGEISLSTQPMHEDTVLRVRAIRDTDLPEGQPILQAMLDAELPVGVRANPAVAIAVVGSAVHDPGSAVTIRIANSQRSVTYTAYACALFDADFPRQMSSEVSILRVPVSDSEEIYVRAPDHPAAWRDPSPITAEAHGSGTDGDLLLTFPALHEDSVVIVKATKSHAATAGLSSALQLSQATAILLRPEAAPELRATLTPRADGTGGSLLVSGGQQGVFYFFREQHGAPLLGLPAYFHKRDDTDPTARLNRGVGQTWLQTDLVVARDPSPGSENTSDLARRPPADPIIEITPLPSGVTIHVTAVKARTAVAWTSGRTLTISLTQPTS